MLKFIATAAAAQESIGVFGQEDLDRCGTIASQI
jgi:hypothetical protein